MESKSITMDTLENETTNGTLGNNIITANNSIRESCKRPDECSIFDYLRKSANNQNMIQSHRKSRLTNLTNDNKLEIEITNNMVPDFLKNILAKERK